MAARFLAEAEEKAKVQNSKEEVVHPLEDKLGLNVDTVWPARGAALGFVLCCILAWAQPSDLVNTAATVLAPLHSNLGFWVLKFRGWARSDRVQGFGLKGSVPCPWQRTHALTQII